MSFLVEQEMAQGLATKMEKQFKVALGNL